MFANPPVVVLYHHRHHWRWILRRSWLPFLKIPLWILAAALLLSADAPGGGTPPTFLSIIPLALILWEISRLIHVFLDWLNRWISLTSDGRFEYRAGIVKRGGLGVSARFGAIHYQFRDLAGRLLDCADLVLPFGSDLIEDVPHFREFWEIIQGRR